jgi:hypothetical protein
MIVSGVAIPLTFRARATRLQSHNTHVLPPQQHQNVRSLNHRFKRDYSSNIKHRKNRSSNASLTEKLKDAHNIKDMVFRKKAVVYRHGFRTNVCEA